MRHQTRQILTVELLEHRQMLAAGSVVISEVMYHPFVTDVERVSGLKDRDLEFIEFANVTDQTVNLAGFKISDAIDYAFGNVSLEPGKRVAVVHNREAFEAKYGDQFLIAGEYEGTLGNGGDRILFNDDAGQTLQDVTYDDAWYPVTDGDQGSLVAIDLANSELDRNLADGWKASDHRYGSPGHADGELDPRPKDFSFSIKSSRHVELRWNAPDHFIADFQGYAVYRDGELIGETSGTSLLDSGISPKSSYVFQVAVVNADGRRIFGTPQTVISETVGGNLAFSEGISRGSVQIGLSELSGMTGSRKNENVFWIHNDGPQTAIHAINETGQRVGTIQLSNIPTHDWEDIAIGPGPQGGVDYIYVGDIGGKKPKVNEVRVYRIPEPEVSASDSGATHEIGSVDTITMRFPDGELFNSEALLSDSQTGDLYIIPKLGSGTPIFRAAAATLIANDTILLQRVGQIGFPNVSGGDISPDGNEIVIRNEDLAQIFHRSVGQSIAEAFLSGANQLIPIVGRPTEPNGEAITFDSQGRDYLTLSEGNSPALYSFRRIPTALPGDANRDQIFNSSDLVRAFQGGKYETGQPALFSEGDWDGDGYFGSGDLVVAFQTARFERPAPALESAVSDFIYADWFHDEKIQGVTSADRTLL